MEQNGIILERAVTGALEAIEGLEDRVCPVLDIQKSTGPLIVYDQDVDDEEKTLSGTAGLFTAEYQVHVLHNTYLKMRQLAEQVKTALKALQGYQHESILIEDATVKLESRDILETKVQLFRRTYRINFQYQFKEE